MLDEISSAENIGSIARSAAALGVNSYLTPSQAPHPYGRRAIRVSMGYISMLKTHIYDDIFAAQFPAKLEPCSAKLKNKGPLIVLKFENILHSMNLSFPC
jgi:tRNA(Leu) C34 or U34 (ribose-2'-O)-methylase TrmL